MKVLGVVSEYNPFHNGHLYHLEQSKKLFGTDYAICVMSGNFIQRGEPAIINKWARTRMALTSGFDLVIELPVVYAMSSAEYFAFGAVKLLDSLGIVDCLCFGSENGRIEELDLISGILIREPSQYKEFLKGYLDKGLSFPSARENALKDYLQLQSFSLGSIEDIIGQSNNILGIEYLKALKKLQSSITPVTIKRTSNSYNSEELTGSISSATSIRKNISNHNTANTKDTGKHIDALKSVLPENCFSIMEEEFSNGRGPVFLSDFDGIVLSSLRQMTKEQIASLPYVSEGLENRIKAAAEDSGSIDELLKKVATKRYPQTRIQRTILNILTGITSTQFDLFNKYGGPQYIRVLGFTEKGRKLISKVNANSRLPVIVKSADFKNSCNPLLRSMLEIEAFSTDMYVLAYNNRSYRKAGQDFTQNIIYLKA